MNAVDVIKNNTNYEQLLHYYDFNHVRSDGYTIRSCCKIHGGSNPTAFVVNLENGLWYCHTGECGGGDVFHLVQLLDGISFKEAVVKLAMIFNIDLANATVGSPSSQSEEAKKWMLLMSKIKSTPLVEYIPDIETKGIATYRKFLPSTIETFGLKYAEEITLTKRNGEKYSLKHRLVFPIMFDGIQVGVSLRRVKTNDIPKWSHQPVYIHTKDILYNYDRAKDSSFIVVVEGILDVWAYHEIGIAAVATFGAHLTDAQYRLLLKTGADIVLSYDGDAAGITASIKAYAMLMNKCRIYRVNFSVTEDPENIPREELRRRYENKQQF